MEIQEYIAKLIFIVFAVGGTFSALWSMAKSASAAKWPTTLGVVEMSALDEEDGSDGNMYKPMIEYSYAVNGRSYRSGVYAFGYHSNTLKWMAKDILMKYPKESKVKVFYKKTQPHKSVLLTGIHLFHLVQLIFFGVISCIVWTVS